VTSLPRLRQVALAARDLAATAKALQDAFGWPDPYHDPGVAEFGLENSVFAAGDTFIEVVSPVRPGTAAGRYIERRNGDSGYMAIFQVGDVEDARERAVREGMRVVWRVDLPDIAGTHLHPKDTPGAIVSLDWADPVQTWRWAGPDWTGKASQSSAGSITGLVVEAKDPAFAAKRWAAPLGLEAEDDAQGGARIELSSAKQVIRFVRAQGDRAEGITEIGLEARPEAGPVDAEIGGVRFVTGAAR
jgi:hypothetical protein